MDYKPLKIVKFMNKDTNEKEYHKRFNGFGTIKTNLFPYLMKRGEFKSSQFELFSVPLEEIQLLSQQVTENSNHIKYLSAQLPDVAKRQFYKDQLYKAIISTDEIEGVKTTRKEVSIAHQALANKKKGQVRLLSTVRMYNDIQENAFLKIEKLETVRQIYDELTQGEIDEDDLLDGTLFRNKAVSIVDSSNYKVDHIAPSSENQISQMLLSWINFINNQKVPFLIKAMLAHYFFENVHPFYDGNGRTGRYILSRYLARKLDIFSGLVISQKINENKKKYYSAFKTTGDVDNKAEGTLFVLTLLEILHEGQQDIIEILEDKRILLDNYNEELAESVYTKLQKNILFLLFQSKIFVDDWEEGIIDNEIIDILSHNFPRSAVKREIDKLEAQGKIELISQRPKRHGIITK